MNYFAAFMNCSTYLQRHLIKEIQLATKFGQVRLSALQSAKLNSTYNLK